MAMLLEEIRAWQPGHPLDPATNVGALADRQQLDTVLGYIAAGHAAGAALRCGGRRCSTG